LSDKVLFAIIFLAGQPGALSLRVLSMSTLNEIIEWLTWVEETSARLYEKAALIYQDVKEFADLLRRLSADERLHHELVVKAGLSIHGSGEDGFITLDPETKRKVERRFDELKEKLDGGLSREELAGDIVTLEFSELNDIFLYAVDSLRESSPGQFSLAVREIEKHKERIKAFLGKPGFEELLRRTGQFPKLVKDRILLVEDIDANLKLLQAVLEGEGSLEAATNGDEALKIMESVSFSAVVADIDMPVMDGIELYSRAVDRYPQLKTRFVFFTAMVDADRLRFFRDHNLKFIQKPASISDIRSAVREIIHSDN